MRHNRLVCFASGPQYGTRVWSKGLTERVTPYVHADPHCARLKAARSTPIHQVAAAASLLGTIKCFDAEQQSGSTRTFEVRYSDNQSAALATDFTTWDIFFTAAVPNTLLRNQLITSISELLGNDCSTGLLILSYKLAPPWAPVNNYKRLSVRTIPSTVS